MMPYEIKTLTEEEADGLLEKLADYLESEAPSDPSVPAPEAEPLVFIVRNDEKNVIAGCIVHVHEWGRAVLATLWTDERFRGLGLGSLLIRAAERAVREKGCHIMCLGTMDFMARPLYEKHGYRVFSVSKDYPKGHEGWSLMKRLDLGLPDYVPSNNSAASRYEVEHGTKEDAKTIENGLEQYDTGFVADGHDAIPIGRKLVDKDGRLIAGIYAYVDGWNGCDIDVLWVEEAFRRRGLGSLLLRETAQAAKENGAFVMFADAGDWNVGFFRKNGFDEKGRLEDYPKGRCCYELEKRL